MKPWSKVLDNTNPPFTKWYYSLNVDRLTICVQTNWVILIICLISAPTQVCRRRDQRLLQCGRSPCRRRTRSANRPHSRQSGHVHATIYHLRSAAGAGLLFTVASTHASPPSLLFFFLSIRFKEESYCFRLVAGRARSLVAFNRFEMSKRTHLSSYKHYHMAQQSTDGLSGSLVPSKHILLTIEVFFFFHSR